MKALVGFAFVVVGYIALVGLNATVGYRECRAEAIHNDLNAAGPCAVAHAIRR